MSFTTQPFCSNGATKTEVTVTTSAGTSQIMGQLSGPVQVRVVNYDTVRVGLRFGAKTYTDAATIAASKTIPAGAVEVFTVQPNPDGSPVYWNIIGDAGAAGNKFEVTQGAGY